MVGLLRCLVGAVLLTCAWSIQPRGGLASFMQRLYQRSARGVMRRGNTVHGLRAEIGPGPVYSFNLSSVPDSETVLAASLHFSLHHVATPCSSISSCHHFHLVSIKTWASRIGGPSKGKQYQQGDLSPQNSTMPQTYKYMARSRSQWEARDIKSLLQMARNENFGLFHISFSQGSIGEPTTMTDETLPYIVVYADDVMLKNGPFAPSAPGELPTQQPREQSRSRRQASLQTNELPKAKKRLVGSKRGESNREEHTDETERTRRAERRRGNGRHRICSRRPLKVNFADFGWDQWIISPTGYNAYYCVGSCEFPMPKVVKPSNHATIQSIVRAAHLTPGLPEPCCIPDKMAPLSILFFDSTRNVVLKLYPNMSVINCACR
uniref:Growth differentiation factor 10 n=1 Tax=Eptatretus burgeri TaxID=7764 RepID=A0A8C4NAA1_EPTBU